MAEKKMSRISSAELRRRAEDLIKETRTGRPGTEGDPRRLTHELQVHEVELEMQNAELLQARDDVETMLEKYTDLYDFVPAGYFTLDREGTIRNVNLTGAGLLGIDRSQLNGQSFGHFVADEARPAFTTLLEEVFTSLAKETCEVALLTEGASQLFVQIEALAAASGEECHIALIDITKRKQAEGALRWWKRLPTRPFERWKRLQKRPFTKRNRQKGRHPGRQKR